MATVTINILTKQSGDGLEKTADQIKKVETASASAEKASSSWLGGMLQFAAGGLLASGLTAIAGSVKDFVAGSIEASRDAAKIMAQTESVVRSTGGAAGYTAQQIQEMAGSLSAAAGKSLFDDDDIQRGQNLLLTFTNIKETLPDTTAAMVDIATAMGTDVKSGAIQLGKALNDPIKGVGALSRIGVSFTQQQKDQIKAMAESGRMADAQRVILAELNKEFGGSAQAAANASGGTAMFEAKLGDLQKTIGAALLPIVTRFTGFLASQLFPVLETLVPWIADNLTAAFDALSPTIDAAQTAFDSARSAIGEFVDTGARVADTIGWLIDLFGQSKVSTGELQTAIDQLLGYLGFGGDAYDQVYDAAVKVFGITKNLIDQIKSGKPILQSITEAWDKLAAAFGPSISEAVPKVIEELNKLSSDVVTWIGEQDSKYTTKLGEWTTAFYSWVAPAIPPMIASLMSYLSSLWPIIAAQATELGKALSKWATAFVAWVVPAGIKFLREWPGILNRFLDLIGEQAGPLLQQLYKWVLQFIVFIGPYIPKIIAALAAVSAAMFVWLAETAVTLSAKLAIWAYNIGIWWVDKGQKQLQTALGSLGVQLMLWIAEKAVELGTAISAWSRQMWQWVMTTAWPSMLASLRAFINSITTWAGQQGTAISGAFKNLANDMIKAITDTLARTTALKDAILKAVQDAWRAAIGWLTGSSGGGGGGGGTGGGRGRSGLLATAGATVSTESLGVAREMSMSVPGSAGGMTTVNHYNYSPTYSSAPSSPIADFRMMESIARMI